MDMIKPELLANYTSKNITFLGIDVRINFIFFLIFFFHISKITFYLFLASMVVGWILAFMKYDVFDFFIFIKEGILKLFKVNNIKRLRY